MCLVPRDYLIANKHLLYQHKMKVQFLFHIKNIYSIFLIMLLYSCTSKPQPKPDKELAKKSFIQLEKDILGTEPQAFGTIDQVLNDADRSLDNLIVLDQKGWVRVSEKRDFDGSVSPDEARERLLKILRNKAIKKKVGTEVEIVSLLSDVMVGGGQEVFEKFGIVKIRRTHPGMVITLLDYVFKKRKNRRRNQS